MTLATALPAAHPDRIATYIRRPRHRLATALGFGLLGLAADLWGGSAPLAFAAVLILGIGLPHGASDHLMAMGGRSPLATPKRFAVFLALYLGAILATLALWYEAPGPSLAAFLLLSEIHFALDDVPNEPWHRRAPERLARGLMPICLPALLHSETLAVLFATLSTPQDGQVLASICDAVAPSIIGLAVFCALLRLQRGEHEQAAEIIFSALALVLYAPLVGFALVFALVHSRGQTRERIACLHLAGLRSYLLHCVPTLVGAGLLFASLAAVFIEAQASQLGTLFIGLAALTVPHMLVTPLFRE